MSVNNPVVVDGNDIYILQAGLNIYVKTADLCAMLKKSNQWIGQLTCQGTLAKTKTSHGSLFELKQNLPNYCAMLESRQSKVTEEDEEIEKRRRVAEANLKTAKASVAAFEADELKGQMHRADDIKALTEDMVYTIRSALLALPGRLAVDTAAAVSAAETSDIIRKEVIKIMTELSNYEYDPAKYKELVRERRDWTAEESEEAADE